MRGKPNDFGINKVNDSLTLIIVSMCFMEHKPTTKYESNVDLAWSKGHTCSLQHSKKIL